MCSSPATFPRHTRASLIDFDKIIYQIHDVDTNTFFKVINFLDPETLSTKLIYNTVTLTSSKMFLLAGWNFSGNIF